MYKVSRQVHEKYGNVVEIIRDDSGSEQTPFQAAQQAIGMRRLWKEETKGKVRILIDGQVLTTAQAESWSKEEYESLPKCKECGKILSGDVHTHQLCSSNLFCSRNCADKNYDFQIEKMNDNEETEFDL
jgi:hypothetical protein